MLCCGEDVKTPFCPSCGKKNPSVFPLQELLAHVRSQCGAKLTMFKINKRKEERGEGEYWGYRAKGDMKKHERWKRWMEALEKVIGESDET